MNRRSFLGWTATGGAGLLLPGIMRARPQPTVFDMGRSAPSLNHDFYTSLAWSGEYCYFFATLNAGDQPVCFRSRDGRTWEPWRL
jgi:hypothetical protein